VVLRGIGFAAQCGHRLAVHLDASRQDQLLSFAARGNTCSRNDLLQSLTRSRTLAFTALIRRVFARLGHECAFSTCSAISISVVGAGSGSAGGSLIGGSGSSGSGSFIGGAGALGSCGPRASIDACSASSISAASFCAKGSSSSPGAI